MDFISFSDISRLDKARLVTAKVRFKFWFMIKRNNDFGVWCKRFADSFLRCLNLHRYVFQREIAEIYCKKP